MPLPRFQNWEESCFLKSPCAPFRNTASAAHLTPNSQEVQVSMCLHQLLNKEAILWELEDGRTAAVPVHLFYIVFIVCWNFRWPLTSHTLWVLGEGTQSFLYATHLPLNYIPSSREHCFAPGGIKPEASRMLCVCFARHALSGKLTFLNSLIGFLAKVISISSPHISSKSSSSFY